MRVLSLMEAMADPSDVVRPAAAGAVEIVVLDATPPFDAFFRAEYPGLVAFAAAVTGDVATGEDVAAEAMSRALRDWDRVSRYDRPGAWARRVAINLLHSRRRRLATEIAGRLRLRSPGHTDDRTAEVAGADHFARLLAPLPPRQRITAALHYLDDLPVAEIADLMGCSPGTVKSQLHDARAAIARTLEEHRHAE